MYVYDIRPTAKPRMTRSDRWKLRPCVARYWEFKDRLRELVKEEIGGSLSLMFLIRMPDSWSGVKQEKMLGTPHLQTPDLDNLMKGFKDALLSEDKGVYEYKYCGKFWWDEDKIILLEDADLGEISFSPEKILEKG